MIIFLKNFKFLLFFREQERTIAELSEELEYERLRREKLELQLDHTRQELEKAIKSVREYETKVLVLERYLQHLSKEDSKQTKKKVQASGVKGGTTRTRSKSASKRDTKADKDKEYEYSKRERRDSDQVETPSSKAKANNILDETIQMEKLNFFLYCF